MKQHVYADNKTLDVLIKIPLQEIVYIECMEKKVMVHTSDDMHYLVDSSIREMGEYLKPRGFVVPYRSYVVNCDYISYVDTGCLWLYVPYERRTIEISVSEMRQQETEKIFEKHKQQCSMAV